MSGKPLLFICSLWVFFAGCWITNVVKLVNTDFESPYKYEVIHAVGIFVPPASVITVWFSEE
jgi:hypothetical protein